MTDNAFSFVPRRDSNCRVGLLGLDLAGLRIVISGGTPTQKRYAEKIWTVRKRGNFLLCSLLLGNVAVNAGGRGQHASFVVHCS